jgi:hypothetical protein
MSSESQHQRESWRLPARIGLALFTAIAVFYLWTEHRAHLFGALPWLLLLACSLMHLFMHRGHGHGGHRHHAHRDERVS